MARGARDQVTLDPQATSSSEPVAQAAETLDIEALRLAEVRPGTRFGLSTFTYSLFVQNMHVRRIKRRDILREAIAQMGSRSTMARIFLRPLSWAFLGPIFEWLYTRKIEALGFLAMGVRRLSADNRSMRSDNCSVDP